LSHLCALVLQYHQEQQTYGLKLPDKTIQPASGDAHKNTCLMALALFGEVIVDVVGKETDNQTLNKVQNISRNQGHNKTQQSVT
ncbi:MAG: hypothetical protein ACI88H_003560, partial [Cocleimonas sp.]